MSPLWNSLLTELRTKLVELYDSPEDIKRVLQEAGLNITKIKLQGTPENIWHNALDEAIKIKGVIPCVVRIADREYGLSETLKQQVAERYGQCGSLDRDDIAQNSTTTSDISGNTDKTSKKTGKSSNRARKASDRHNKPLEHVKVYTQPVLFLLAFVFLIEWLVFAIQSGSPVATTEVLAALAGFLISLTSSGVVNISVVTNILRKPVVDKVVATAISVIGLGVAGWLLFAPNFGALPSSPITPIVGIPRAKFNQPNDGAVIHPDQVMFGDHQYLPANSKLWIVIKEGSTCYPQDGPVVIEGGNWRFEKLWAPGSLTGNVTLALYLLDDEMADVFRHAAETMPGIRCPETSSVTQLLQAINVNLQREP